MQTLNFSVGNWMAHASVHEMDKGRLLAIVCAMDAGGTGGRTRHTLVFDRSDHRSNIDETTARMCGLLQARYKL